MKKKKKGLVGKFFHSLSSDFKIKWQGYILDEPKKNTYLVQMFDWLMGEPAEQQLVTLDEMKGWLFYDTADDMRHSYQYGTAHALRNSGEKMIND